MKIGEEYGEAVQALIGVLNANPRKGRSHTWEDVADELKVIVARTLARNGVVVTEPWCVLHRTDHSATACARRRDNDLMCNGHKARQCPRRLDVTMTEDDGLRWIHGNCKPSSVELKFEGGDGNSVHTVTGDVIGVDRTPGHDRRDRITIKMEGMTNGSAASVRSATAMSGSEHERCLHEDEEHCLHSFEWDGSMVTVCCKCASRAVGSR